MKSLRAGPGLLLSGSGRGAVLTPFQRTKIVRRVRPPAIYTQALTVAGVIPTAAEIATAMVSAYTTAAVTPTHGDMVNLTVSGACKLRAVVTLTGTASGLYVVLFTVSSVDYYAQVVQTGLY